MTTYMTKFFFFLPSSIIVIHLKMSNTTPQMILIPNSPIKPRTTIRGTPSGHFTGEVQLERAHHDANISVNTVNFAPGARTHWHRHTGGQLLQVVAGSGWVCEEGGVPQRITAGDVVWCPVGGRHWHGAERGSFLVHLAVSIGETVWDGPVGDAEYVGR